MDCGSNALLNGGVQGDGVMHKPSFFRNLFFLYSSNQSYKFEHIGILWPEFFQTFSLFSTLIKYFFRGSFFSPSFFLSISLSNGPEHYDVLLSSHYSLSLSLALFLWLNLPYLSLSLSPSRFRLTVSTIKKNVCHTVAPACLTGKNWSRKTTTTG